MKEQMGYEDEEDAEEADANGRTEKKEAANGKEEVKGKKKADRPSVRTTRKKILPPVSLTKSASNLGKARG
jgi:hypothetical protein